MLKFDQFKLGIKKYENEKYNLLTKNFKSPLRKFENWGEGCLETGVTHGLTKRTQVGILHNGGNQGIYCQFFSQEIDYVLKAYLNS